MTAFLQPTGQQPRGAVKLNGTLITGWVDFEVTNNAYYSADTFRCKFAGALLPASQNAIWFAQQQDMFVELFIGFPADPNNFTPADLKSWIYGQVDHIQIDPVTNTIEVDGRDLTRVFIDTKTTQKWPNQTSSQIATALANAHGLTPVVQVTTTPVGKYYEIDHVNMADERSEWDLLTYLADLEGFKVWVRGQNLYFQPPATLNPPDLSAQQAQLAQLTAAYNVQVDQASQLTQQSLSLSSQGFQQQADGNPAWRATLQQSLALNQQSQAILSQAAATYNPQIDALKAQIANANNGAYQIVYQVATTSAGPKANFEAVKFTRALTVSRGIQVKIRSWNKKYAKGFTVSYPSSVKTIKVGESSVGSGAQIYSKTIPNLTQDQALQKAQNWYQQIVAHEMKIEGLTMPGDNNLDTTSIIQLSGTGTAFDQMYFPDCITRTLDFENGYGMTISAKNHAPDSTVEI